MKVVKVIYFDSQVEIDNLDVDLEIKIKVRSGNKVVGTAYANRYDHFDGSERSDYVIVGSVPFINEEQSKAVDTKVYREVRDKLKSIASKFYNDLAKA